MCRPNFHESKMETYLRLTWRDFSFLSPRRITTTAMGSIQTNTKHSSTTITSFPADSSSFLEESSFEIQNADPSFENLFIGDTSRFNNRPCFDNSTTIETSKDNTDLASFSLQNSRLDATPTKKRSRLWMLTW